MLTRHIRFSGNSSSAPNTHEEALHARSAISDPRLRPDPAPEASKFGPSHEDPSNKEVSNAGVVQRHKSIKHQLRLMFIYPIVYFLLSIPPFINHCWLYTKNPSPPFALTTLAVVCLAGQGAADCIIFMTREKPWRLVKLQSARPIRENYFRHQSVHHNGIELTTAKTGIKLNGGGISGEPRQWWDQEAYSLGGESEGSRACDAE